MSYNILTGNMEIKVANDFGKRLIGRDIGETSAEKFRSLVVFNLHRMVASKKSILLVIDFIGVTMTPSSWLEEVFGGLVRLGYKKTYLKSKIVIKNMHNSERVFQYIDEANLGY